MSNVNDTLIHAIERLVEPVDTGAEQISPRQLDDENVECSSYFHVDNGGITLTVDTLNNITIEVGFFGYSNTTVQLGCIQPEQLAIELLKLSAKCKSLQGKIPE